MPALILFLVVVCPGGLCRDREVFAELFNDLGAHVFPAASVDEALEFALIAVSQGRGIFRREDLRELALNATDEDPRTAFLFHDPPADFRVGFGMLRVELSTLHELLRRDAVDSSLQRIDRNPENRNVGMVVRLETQVSVGEDDNLVAAALARLGFLRFRPLVGRQVFLCRSLNAALPVFQAEAAQFVPRASIGCSCFGVDERTLHSWFVLVLVVV